MNHELLDRVLRSPKLPSLPTIAVEIISLTQNSDVDFDELAGVIQLDPALSSSILRTVNSSFYGQVRAISTLNRALTVLGLSAVKALALGFTLVANFKKPGDDGLDHVTYWRRSLYTAAAARTLGQRAGIAQREEAFLAGLLQDVGMVAMHQALGHDYTPLLEKAGRDHASLHRHEVEALGLNHAQVGAALAETWKLPPLLVEPIRYHEDPDGADPELLPLVQSVVLGNRVADIFLSTEGDGAALDSYRTQAEAWFSFPRDQAEPLLKQIHEQTDDMSRLFDVPTGNLGNPDEILSRANQALLQITLQSQQQNRKLSTEVSTDALTGASNRRAFDQCLQEQFELATPSQPVSLLFTDVDHFKSFNDTHGHAVGDRVLVVFANTLQSAVGDHGRVFRYGGEEFAIVCPATDAESATQLAERTRCAVADQARVGRHDDERELCITCSIGVATHTGVTFDRVGQLLKAADQGVYAAKAAGRNCVRYSPSEAPNPEAVLTP